MAVAQAGHAASRANTGPSAATTGYAHTYSGATTCCSVHRWREENQNGSIGMRGYSGGQ